MTLREPLLTDLYQFTMAQAAWQSGKDKVEASFYAHFRKNPFEGGYAVACGAASIAEFIEKFTFTDDDLNYLESLPAQGGTRLFDPAFLKSLKDWELSVDIDCAEEGTVVFAQEPVMRVSGPLSQCMLLETPLINLLGYQTLIATKAARICHVTKKPVAEFGLRRAHGPNGGNLASRAAFVGGCSSTSNVHAGMLYNIPVSGTHSHAWVMAFDSELEAFRAYVQSFPHNAVLLVDTYDALKGTQNAITVAKEMRARGEELSGIRIDSGDLAWLSISIRKMLDEAGCAEVRIIATNNLDEHTILSLEAEQGASIDSWGVGTNLAVAFDQPALGMVYKLSAIKSPEAHEYTTVLKTSEQSFKSTLPGILSSRRYYDSNGFAMGDMVYDQLMPPASHLIIDPSDRLRQKDLSNYTYKELLFPLVRGGRAVAGVPDATVAQAHTRANMQTIPLSNRRLLNPHSYPVGLEQQLLENRDKLLRSAR
ncbi:MAG: nicotinate phosphoribosyltransferase [Coriobacteriales bacterium]|jgi:nicotinate phosphoribosyltransferase|nr:nicotinate phosphoribosyltransferase [Coriobacteriales bacterium]